MKDRRMLIIGGLAAVLLIAIPLTVYIANQQQDVRSRADEGTFVATNLPTSTSVPTQIPTATSVPSPTGAPTATPTIPTSPTPLFSASVTPSGGSCQAPESVNSVTFDYPSCTGTQCNFSQASCTWTAVNGATSYSVKITQVETGVITSTTSVTAPSATTSFPVEQGKTYRCEISAVNACGASGPAGSAEALCAVDGQVSAAPSATPRPTTARVIPTLPPTGDVSTTTMVGIGGVLVTLLGGILFFFSSM